MKLYLFILAITGSIIMHVQGGESGLYMPHNMQQAYKSETRSNDGQPGKNYWQNRAEYKMDVTVYPWSRLLKGEQTIQYFNNSPDTLNELVIRLYPDVYKIGNLRDDQIKPEALHTGVLFTDFKINTQKVDLYSKEAANWRSGTLLTLPLKKELQPGSAIKIESAWQYTIANVSQIRGGAYDASSFFVSYWYPRVSVYDDINGWDKSNYTGGQEFYNDFCSYDVNINLPDGYTVWATGTLNNPAKVLPEKQLSRYKKAQKSGQIIHIIEEKDYFEDDLVMNPDKNPWHFKAANVTDFAFAFSDYYLWDASTLALPGKDEPVFIAAAYNPKSMDFYEVARIARETIQYFSETMPAITFPFPELTVFNGKGGMEFPMILNDGSTSSYDGAVGLTSHEIMHSYFPFYMGTNEKKYAWMDEGLAVALSFDLQKHLSPDGDRVAARVQKYLRIAGHELEVPCMVSSLHLTDLPYRNAAYDKPAMAYHFLRDVLGDELFLKALHAYVDRWNGKHPIPYDFFYTFEQVTGEDLSWFWKPWFFDFAYPDLAVKEVAADRIIIERKGAMPLPLDVTVQYTDGSDDKIYHSAAVWKTGNRVHEISSSGDKKIAAVKLGSNRIPDVEQSNNVWSAE